MPRTRASAVAEAQAQAQTAFSTPSQTPPGMPSSASSTPRPSLQGSLRVSQRPPTACRECSLRKVRCDKQTPCGRCVRLSRRCTREVVRISKALSQHREEIGFLRSLRQQLLANSSSSADNSPIIAAVADIDARIRLLEHGKAGPDETEEGQTAHDDESAEPPRRQSPTESKTPQPSRQPNTWQNRTDRTDRTDTTDALTASLTAFEFLAWGRHVQACFPHRRCRCYQHRRYSELVSINSDPAWVGRLAMNTPASLQHSLYAADPQFLPLLPPPALASRLVQFHLDYLHWHHDVFHAPTFLDRCHQFWATGTTDHPLWLALYLAVCSVSLWSLLNAAPQHYEAVFGKDGDDMQGADAFVLDAALVERQFQAMVHLLYAENFLEHLSLYAVQAIVLSTRIAHNLDRSELNATLVGAAVRIAHCLGLHKIADPDKTGVSLSSLSASPQPGTAEWYERIEMETGKRVWAQLLIQDHFQIPFTDSYIIHPAHYTTPLPENCNDHDMVSRPSSIPTNSSYVRMLAHTAALMPSLLDGLGPLRSRKTPTAAYEHIAACDAALRANIAQIPPFLLREDWQPERRDRLEQVELPWLPLARRTLAISAAEKIIMIHRPALLASFQTPASSAGRHLFQPTRTICVAAAVSILRTYEKAVAAEDAVPIWTHSAFCVTGAVVVGLSLLFHHVDQEVAKATSERQTGHGNAVHDNPDSTAHVHRQLLVATAERLRSRVGDVIARRGAQLIDTLLAAEEDLVLRLLRLPPPSTSTPFSSAASRKRSLADHQRAIINDMISSHEFLARFLAHEPLRPDDFSFSSLPMTETMARSTATTTVSTNIPPRVLSVAALTNPVEDDLPASPMDPFHDTAAQDAAQDFHVWFDSLFAPLYDSTL